jgi:hypothetical protein
MDVARRVSSGKTMTSKNHFDSGAWMERLQIASDQLRTMVDELATLCKLRGTDLEADWCRELVLATVHVQEAFQHVEASFEADGWGSSQDLEVLAEPTTGPLANSNLNG